MRHWRATALAVFAMAGGSTPAVGQDTGVQWLVEEPFAPLIADAREPQLRGGAHWINRDLTGFPGADPEIISEFEDGDWEGEVVLAYRTAVVSFQRESETRPAIAIGFEVGIFTRFLLDSDRADFVNADFRVGFPVQVVYRGWEGRAGLQHLSSHLGDDVMSRFDVDLVDPEVNSERLQVVAARRLDESVRLYAGTSLDLGSNESVEKWAAQWGVEWDETEAPGRDGTRPLLAADFRLDELTNRLAANLIAGVTFQISETRIQVGARGHFGPSAVGRLRTLDETTIGFWFRFIP